MGQTLLVTAVVKACLQCVQDQNRLLDNMGEGFLSVGDMLSRSLMRIGTMLESGGANHMCYLVGFVVFVIMFLYWLVR